MEVGLGGADGCCWERGFPWRENQGTQLIWGWSSRAVQDEAPRTKEVLIFHNSKMPEGTKNKLLGSSALYTILAFKNQLSLLIEEFSSEWEIRVNK